MSEISENDRRFMRRACELAEESVRRGGGPFGAVIVHNGYVIAEGVNSVTKSFDPTAHAEINAIRQACANGLTHSLKGCVIYSSCEPCPMCLSALYWAGIERIYYGNTEDDARSIEFSDKYIMDQLRLPVGERSIPEIRIVDERSPEAFRMWSGKADKVTY